MRSRRARNIRDAPAVELLRVPLAGTPVYTQTRRSILLVAASSQRGLGWVIAHLAADLKVGGPLPRRHSGYVYFLKWRCRLVLALRVLLEVHVLVRVLPGLGIAPAEVSAHVRAAGGRQVVALTLEAYVLVGMIVHVSAVLRVATLEQWTGPEARRRGECHLLVKVLLIVGLLGVSEGVSFTYSVERAGAMRGIRYTALRQSLEVVVKGVRRQGRGLARVVAVLLEGLTGRWGERTWHVEAGRVVLLLRKHLRHAEGLPLPDACVYLAKLAAEHVLDVGDALCRACEDVSVWSDGTK